MVTGPAAPSANSPRSLQVSRVLVRPGHKGGGTVVVFKLRRSVLLRVTVLRVFPTCEVVGSFRVRGRAGVNRVPFRGRLRGRPLRSGTYRLLIAAGSARNRAEATVVIAHGKVSGAKLRKARSANACAPAIGFDWTAPGLLFSDSPGGGTGAGEKGGKGEKGIAAPLLGAVKGAVSEGEQLAGRAREALEEPTSTLLLVAVAMFTLTIASIGLLLAVNLLRWRDERLYR
jgi:hypothetical protein